MDRFNSCTLEALDYVAIMAAMRAKRARPQVLRSIETQDGGLCVDVFKRPDETFGFEEYRRDADGDHGWFRIGFFSDLVFDSETAALSKAIAKVPWLAEACSS
eukprot:TRINITY_DN5765_c0_g1_i1.p1 TRINITY_DN5765_c0_g1~~TRINITY_DN5765_c0_g1_i1.p1  ORF type:complete len:103 (-),score=22.92 TRINITY_DN5765_c0_g1_i1:108-416(-)